MTEQSNEIQSISDLTQILKELGEPIHGKTRFFRGQAKEWELLPSIYRKDKPYYIENEDKIIKDALTNCPDDFPPKNLTSSPWYTQTWSPPRPKAISKAAFAFSPCTFTVSSVKAIPILMVGGICFDVVKARILSNKLNFDSIMCNIAALLILKVYVSSVALRIKPSC